MSIQKKIDDIEFELSRTQVNKGTMHHICMMRAKLARYTKMLKPRKYELDGDISSQFISGLLFALPLLEKDSTISI